MHEPQFNNEKALLTVYMFLYGTINPPLYSASNMKSTLLYIRVLPIPSDYNITHTIANMSLASIRQLREDLYYTRDNDTLLESLDDFLFDHDTFMAKATRGQLS